MRALTTLAIRVWMLAWLGALLGLLAAPGELHAQACATPASLRFDIAGKISRSQTGFTQGLEFRDGKLYESTGRVGGPTRLNVISLTGAVTTLADLGQSVFGEGLTILNDEVVQLTWQEKIVFVHDLAGKLVRRMRNPRDGWGLANDGKQLIFTDGGAALHFADPKTFRIAKSVTVRSSWAREVRELNELEFVDGKLYANIFMTWSIVRVDPASGCIEAVADLKPLLDAMAAHERAQVAESFDNVLNGIAHDAKSGTFYLTGKRWPVIFTGRFAER